ncbi:hypothetical protein G6F65_010945 [Rhizopus arrhizus]|nr:hypothetical protein G6F65_010945 [Rhizopus arrhizus]
MLTAPYPGRRWWPCPDRPDPSAGDFRAGVITQRLHHLALPARDLGGNGDVAGIGTARLLGGLAACGKRRGGIPRRLIAVAAHLLGQVIGKIGGLGTVVGALHEADVHGLQQRETQQAECQHDDGDQHFQQGFLGAAALPGGVHRQCALVQRVLAADIRLQQDLLIGAGPAAPTAIEGDHLRRPADRQLRACIDEAQDGLTRRHLAITVGIGEGQHAARPAAVAAGAIAAAAHAAAAVAADRLAAGQAEQAQDFIVARGHPAGTQGALEARKRDRGQDRHHGDGDHQLDQREAAFPAQRHWTLPSVLMATMGHRPATGKRRQDERSIRDDGRQRLDDPPSPVRPGASPIAPAQAQASTW